MVSRDALGLRVSGGPEDTKETSEFLVETVMMGSREGRVQRDQLDRVEYLVTRYAHRFPFHVCGL